MSYQIVKHFLFLIPLTLWHKQLLIILLNSEQPYEMFPSLLCQKPAMERHNRTKLTQQLALFIPDSTHTRIRCQARSCARRIHSNRLLLKKTYDYDLFIMDSIEEIYNIPSI